MFKSANDFSIHIESLATQKQSSYIEAILEYCEGNEIEPEELSEMISQSLKDKLAVTPIADVRDVTDAIRELEDRILKQTSATRTAKNREEMYSKEGLAKSIKDDKERLSLRGAMMKKYFDS